MSRAGYLPRLGYDDPPPAYSSIGWERDGELTAGVFFDNWSRTNLFAHIAATQPMTQGFLAAVAAYAFDQLGCARMTFMVHDDNLRCLRFVESMGAIPEAKLSAGHENGDTVFPAPLAPTVVTVSPSETFRETSKSA